MKLWGKSVDLNNFKSDIMFEAIEDSRVNSEDNRDYKDGISKPTDFSHEKLTQWEDIIYIHFLAQKNRCGVPLCVVIQDTPSDYGGENR